MRGRAAAASGKWIWRRRPRVGAAVRAPRPKLLDVETDRPPAVARGERPPRRPCRPPPAAAAHGTPPPAGHPRAATTGLAGHCRRGTAGGAGPPAQQPRQRPHPPPPAPSARPRPPARRPASPWMAARATLHASQRTGGPRSRRLVPTRPPPPHHPRGAQGPAARHTGAEGPRQGDGPPPPPQGLARAPPCAARAAACGCHPLGQPRRWAAERVDERVAQAHTPRAVAPGGWLRGGAGGSGGGRAAGVL